MKKVSVILAVIAVAGVAAYLGLGRLLTQAAAKAPTAAPNLAAVRASEAVVADARVVPVRHAALSLPAGGLVAEVLVAEGEHVLSGQALLRLDAARSRAAAAQAEAAVQRAQAHLQALQAGPRPQEVAVAAAALWAAQASLLKVQAGPDEGLVIAARAEAANAEAMLQQAQAAYDRIAWQPGSGARPEALQLQQATNAFVAAKAKLDLLLKGPRPGDVDMATAEVRRAEAQLALVKAGARAEEVTAAQADVASARAGLEAAQAALAETELRAPFAGTVAALDIAAGEQVAPGVPLVQLADLSAWEIETEDLTELSIVRVQVGAPVTITLDALPGLELPGKVAHIRAFGASRQGDIVYAVTIVPERSDERLRWNMTAAVAIQPRAASK